MKALLIVDMQSWMFRKSERAEQLTTLLPVIDSLVEKFERTSLPIFNVVTEHGADRSTWSRLMLKYDYSCLIEGSDDAGAVDGFSVPPSADRLVKRANSAFLDTNLDERLKSKGITHLVLSGVFIDGCVGLTAADAAQRGYEVTFVEDAIGHTETKWRSTLYDWLADDYEIEIVNGEDLMLSD